MKKILLFVLCLSTYLCTAQTKDSFTLKGVVLDSAKNEPLEYVTLSLQYAATGEQLKTTLTKEDGSFELAVSKPGAYKLVLASIGYKTKTIQPVQAITNVHKVLLVSTSNQLTEVAVTATRPVIKQEVDRISYDVQSDAESKVLTVLDMLRKVPMVSVDATDNIKLKGTGNYKILINGKESSLIAKNPSDVFKSMPASNILKIEVITTPPAKYDAEGLSGIINIITKKNIDQGYSGGVNARYNTVNGPGINLNGTVKQGKFGVNGYVGRYSQGKRSTAYGSSNEITNPVRSSLLQNGTNIEDWNNIYGNAEISYEIDTLNLLTGNFQGYNNKNTNETDLFSMDYNGDNSLYRSYNLLNNAVGTNKGNDVGLNYQLSFKDKKDQILTASYKYSVSTNRQDNDANYLQDQNFRYPGAIASNYRQFNRSGTNSHTVQLDYVHPIKALTIEAGTKGILRHNYSDFENYNQNAASNEYMLDPSQSNHLNYDQNVFSVYNTYQLKLKSWVMKTGLRVERTTVDANFEGIPLDQRYTNFVPSVSVQRKIDSTNNITFGFTDRLQRPGVWQLNPFIDRSNPKYINTGNPELRPVTSHTFELNYSNFKKGSINIGLNYAFANNTVESVVNVSPDTVTTTTYANVGKNRKLGTDINANIPLTKKLNVNLNLEILRVWLSGTYDGEFYNQKGYQGHAFSYTSYKFEKGYTAGVNIGYDSRYVMLQGRDNEFFFYSGSVSKEFLDKKASISLSANMPFRKYKRIDFYNETPDFSQSSYRDIYSRRFNLSFNYKFGRLKGEIKKNSRGINNDDVSAGGRQ